MPRPERPDEPTAPSLPQQGGVLALDLSSMTGWAYGVPGAPRPLTGVWKLPTHLGMGASYAALENELADFISDWQVAEVIMEAPLGEAMKAAGEGRKNEASARQQLGLAALVLSECYRQDVPCLEEHVNTVRKAVLGTGRLPRVQAKAAVMTYCARMGWTVVDDNAGDAAILWAYRTSVIRTRQRARVMA
jgi:Holliday junction resolvasome RuvABC endonuclease subunit